jgi:TonB family protein
VHPSALNIVIARDGRLLGVELLESSGSVEQDRMLLDAIRQAQPLPPLPGSYRYPTFSAPIRFAPPLRLMFQGKGGMQMPSLMKHGN